MQAVQRRIDRFPYRYDVIDNAYARFLDDGTLPKDCTIARAVLWRVLRARKPSRVPPAADRPLWQPYGSTREMLFREACCQLECVRELARYELQAAVQAGYDPTDPESIGPEMEPIDLAPVCMRLLGFPQDFVRPEYQAQLQRVFRQHEELRLQPRDDDWHRDAGAALAAFMNRGHVPTGSRFFLYVLTIGEQFALVSHYFGKCGEVLLAAYEAVATSTGEERVAALQRLGELQGREGGNDANA